MEILKDKKIYFSSDNHLGLDSLIESHDREKIFVKWLDSICLLYTSPSPRDLSTSRMPSSA